MVVLQWLSVAAVAWFVVVVLLKALKYARTPVHVRWELYPVAHDAGYKHGGSYYENSEWWTQEAKPNRLAELGAMAAEILLLKGVEENNKPLWRWSLPFHLGLYGAFAGLILMVLTAVLAAVGVIGVGWLATVLGVVIAVCCYTGLALVLIGGAGLFARRLTDPDLKRMSAPIDYFNLLFFMAIAVVGLAARTADPRLGLAMSYVYGLVTASAPAAGLPTLVVVEVVLWSLMLVYLPLTRMSHFVAKYFAYHQIRWEDEPNVRGSRLERRVKQALAFGVEWSAPHIQTGKTWAEVATETPQEESST